MKLNAGLRFDHYDVADHFSESGSSTSGNVLSPRIGIAYKVATGTNLRFTYSQGYRSPQIFDEDLHIETSGARQVFHLNDPDLKQETSHSLTLSAEQSAKVGRGEFSLLAEGFYTLLVDPFANEFMIIDSTKDAYYYRVNAEYGAYVAGVNLELNWFFSKKTGLQAGITFHESKYQEDIQWGEEESSVSDKILRNPSSYGYLVFNWKPTDKFTASLNGVYTGRMHVPHLAGGTDPEGNVIEVEKLEHTNPFLDLGVRFSYHFDLSDEICLEAYAGVKNLLNSYQDDFDAGLYRDAGYIYGPGQPIYPFFGIKVSTE